MYIVSNEWGEMSVLETLEEVLEMVKRDFQDYLDEDENCEYSQDNLSKFFQNGYDIYEVKKQLTSNDFVIASKVVKKLVEEKFITLKTD